MTLRKHNESLNILLFLELEIFWEKIKPQLIGKSGKEVSEKKLQNCIGLSSEDKSRKMI